MIPECDPFVTSPRMRAYTPIPSIKGACESERVIYRQASLECFSHRTFIMPSRKSLCLPGMKPELELFQDKCFISLLSIDVRNLTMPCCGKFLHKRFLWKSTARSKKCGHRRYEEEKGNTSWLLHKVSNKATDETANHWPHFLSHFRYPLHFWSHQLINIWSN